MVSIIQTYYHITGTEHLAIIGTEVLRYYIYMLELMLYSRLS